MVIHLLNVYLEAVVTPILKSFTLGKIFELIFLKLCLKGLVSEGVSFRQEYTSKLATFFKLYAKQKVLKLVAITQSLCYESCLMTSPHKFARTLAFL